MLHGGSLEIPLCEGRDGGGDAKNAGEKREDDASEMLALRRHTAILTLAPGTTAAAHRIGFVPGPASI